MNHHYQRGPPPYPPHYPPPYHQYPPPPPHLVPHMPPHGPPIQPHMPPHGPYPGYHAQYRQHPPHIAHYAHYPEGSPARPPPPPMPYPMSSSGEATDQSPTASEEVYPREEPIYPSEEATYPREEPTYPRADLPAEKDKSASLSPTVKTGSFEGTSPLNGPEDVEEEHGSTSPTAGPGKPPPHIPSGTIPDFIKKLFRMLEDTSYSSIVSWGQRGDTFVVKEPGEFAKKVLPRHFKHSNPASFVRQLNKYGFHKIKVQDDGRLYGEHAWEFQHPHFQYNKKDLLEFIRRKPNPTKNKVAVNKEAPPAGPSDALTTELRKDTNDLQTQVDSLTKLQSDIASYLQGLSRNYRMVVEEVLNFRKNMVAQDQVIRNLVEYIVDKESGDKEKFRLRDRSRMGLPPSSEGPSTTIAETSSPFITPFAFTKTCIPSSSPLSQAFNSLQPDLNMNTIMNPEALDLPKDEAKKLLDTYQEVARASFHQMNEISRHVKEAYNIMQSPPPSLSAAVPPNDILAEAPLPWSSATLADSISLGTDVSASNPWDMYKAPGNGMGLQTQGGLTVFTVGGLTPRRDEVFDEQTSSGSSGRSGSPRPPNSMRVTRATFVPPWSVPPKVLLVDDDSTCRKLSSKLLQVFGCSFDVAVDGLDAVNRMGVGNKYDIVLMDIVMPNLDGVSATTRIRQFDQFTPIISMTSNTTENDCMTYLANGMNDILAKPFNKHSMLSMIERYCNHLVGQRAAASLGLPNQIANRQIEAGDSGRISEIIDGDDTTVGAGIRPSPNKGKEPLSSPLDLAPGATNFTDMLNFPMGNLGDLGMLPFGNMGSYMPGLDLEDFDASQIFQSQAPPPTRSHSDSSASLDGTPDLVQTSDIDSNLDAFNAGLGLNTGLGLEFLDTNYELQALPQSYPMKRTQDADGRGGGYERGNKRARMGSS